MPAHLAADFYAVHVWQHQVKHDHIIGIAQRKIKTGAAIKRQINRVAFFRKHPPQQNRQALLVFDY
jgi:hypothetical protein